MNRPIPVINKADDYLKRYLPAKTAYWLRYAGWMIRYYSYLVGLDNRWQMFGRQSRFNWWYLIKAKYENGQSQILPLALQSKRTFWQSLWFDFREAKFHLNMYPRPESRRAYAHYLCEEYPFSNSFESPIQSVIYELHYQNIFPRKKASQIGDHLEKDSQHIILNIFPCPSQ